MRKETVLTEGWRFAKTQASNCWRRSFDDSNFQQVQVPHDYAIEGPFDKNNDLQFIGIESDGRADGLAHSGRTGGLPIGERAVYRKELFVPLELQGNRVTLEFDGVMFNSTVYVNDRKAGGWYYGYTSFEVDITSYVKFGQKNLVAVLVEPHYGMSRWYTGAGIYRKVKLVYKNPAHIAFEGVCVRSELQGKGAKLAVQTDLCNLDAEEGLWLDSIVLSPSGDEVARVSAPVHILPSQTLEQQIQLCTAQLWDQQHPRLYCLISRLHKQDEVVDETKTVFGLRTLEFNQQGFYLNGKRTQIRGVCLHHDQGALGA
ncbi:glycoside hydrolase family 2 sugar binding protein, partial [gut metagenome]